MGGPIAALTERRSALAVTVGEDFRDPRLALDAICAVQIIAVTSASHPLARRGRKTVADLADHLQIVLSDPTPLSEGRSFGVLSPQICRVSNQDTKHAMILGRARLGPPAALASGARRGRTPPGARGNRRARPQRSAVQWRRYLAHRLDEPLGPQREHCGRRGARSPRAGARSARGCAEIRAQHFDHRSRHPEVRHCTALEDRRLPARADSSCPRAPLRSHLRDDGVRM